MLSVELPSLYFQLLEAGCPSGREAVRGCAGCRSTDDRGAARLASFSGRYLDSRDFDRRSLLTSGTTRCVDTPPLYPAQRYRDLLATAALRTAAIPPDWTTIGTPTWWWKRTVCWKARWRRATRALGAGDFSEPGAA